MNEHDYWTIIAMKRFGGSFVVKLAELAERADSENLAKIKHTWVLYWLDYAEKGQKIKKELPY